MTQTPAPLSDAHRDRILQAVDAAFDAQLAFTQELIRHPSVRAAEASAQDLLAEAMAQRGLAIDRWELDAEELATHPGAGKVEISYAGMDNVVGTYEPAGEPAPRPAARSILNGHVDVVPEGPEEQWQRSPWDAAIHDGWLYGRGSGDMKAGLAANLFALDAVRSAGLVPTGRIHVQSVVEEECTGNGSLSALHARATRRMPWSSRSRRRTCSSARTSASSGSGCGSPGSRPTRARWPPGSTPSTPRTACSLGCASSRSAGTPSAASTAGSRISSTPSTSTSAGSRAATGHRACPRGASSTCASRSTRG